MLVATLVLLLSVRSDVGLLQDRALVALKARYGPDVELHAVEFHKFHTRQVVCGFAGPPPVQAGPRTFNNDRVFIFVDGSGFVGAERDFGPSIKQQKAYCGRALTWAGIWIS